MACVVIVNVNVSGEDAPPDPEAIAQGIEEVVPGAEVTVHVGTFLSNVEIDESATT